MSNKLSSVKYGLAHISNRMISMQVVTIQQIAVVPMERGVSPKDSVEMNTTSTVLKVISAIVYVILIIRPKSSSNVPILGYLKSTFGVIIIWR